MNPNFWRVIFAVLLSIAWPEFAGANTLTFTQSTSGAISAVFSSVPCGLGVNPFGTVTVTLNTNQFDISSPAVVFDPPFGCDPTQVPPYTISAFLGTVPDGHYTAVWVYGPAQIAGEFNIISGSLQLGIPPAPALGYLAMFALVFLLIALAAIAKRRNSIAH